MVSFRVAEDDFAGLDAHARQTSCSRAEVLRKADGCADGGSPDPNDWIVDCAAQSQVHPPIVQAIALIDEILES